MAAWQRSALPLAAALNSIKGEVNKESVNEAFKNIKDFKTDMLCKPYYYGEAPLHIPNNTDITVTPKEGSMVEKESCFEISDADAPIKRRQRRPGGGRPPVEKKIRPS